MRFILVGGPGLGAFFGVAEARARKVGNGPRGLGRRADNAPPVLPPLTPNLLGPGRAAPLVSSRAEGRTPLGATSRLGTGAAF
jgi:hypothetical protein